MNSDGSSRQEAASGANPLWDQLARDQRDRAAIGPVLRHLVLGEKLDLFGEETVARTRGMIESLAIELLRLHSENPEPARFDALAAALADSPALLGHVHALALEGQLVVRLNDRGVDPLLPPLVQQRISSPDPQIAGLAIALMAAQTRFVRRQQRMELVAVELSADLLHVALSALERVVGAAAPGDRDAAPARAVAALRSGFDERRGRIGILAQLGLGLGDDFPVALDPHQAGFSLFASALSLITGQDRDQVVLAAASADSPRLPLLMAAAGVEPPMREAVVLMLHPDSSPPPAWFAIDPAEASELLVRGVTA